MRIGYAHNHNVFASIQCSVMAMSCRFQRYCHGNFKCAVLLEGFIAIWGTEEGGNWTRLLGSLLCYCVSLLQARLVFPALPVVKISQCISAQVALGSSRSTCVS